MHGIVFASLHDFLRDLGGAEAVTEVFGDTSYSMVDAHPDESFSLLLARASAFTGVERDELTRRFGAFTGEHTFPRLYPAFYELAPNTSAFLLGVEDRIHELVRATVPNARPPALAVRARGNGGVEITYNSPRRLCDLLEGLVHGTARHYGEQVRVEETACARHGAPACRFVCAARLTGGLMPAIRRPERPDRGRACRLDSHACALDVRRRANGGVMPPPPTCARRLRLVACSLHDVDDWEARIGVEAGGGEQRGADVAGKE